MRTGAWDCFRRHSASSIQGASKYGGASGRETAKKPRKNRPPGHPLPSPFSGLTGPCEEQNLGLNPRADENASFLGKRKPPHLSALDLRDIQRTVAASSDEVRPAHLDWEIIVPASDGNNLLEGFPVEGEHT